MSGPKTTTTVKTQRITSLEPKSGQQLSSLEEAVVRMHHGVSVKPDAQLPTNGFSDEVMQDLLQRELEAFEKTGRIDELDDIPEGAQQNPQTQRIIGALKNKA